MSFDLGRTQTLYNAILASASAGEFDGVDTAIVEMILDLNDLALSAIEAVARRDKRIADLENECRKVGAF